MLLSAAVVVVVVVFGAVICVAFSVTVAYNASTLSTPLVRSYFLLLSTFSAAIAVDVAVVAWLVAMSCTNNNTAFALTTATERPHYDAVVVKQMSFGVALRLSSSVLASSMLKPNTKQR